MDGTHWKGERGGGFWKGDACSQAVACAGLPCRWLDGWVPERLLLSVVCWLVLRSLYLAGWQHSPPNLPTLPPIGGWPGPDPDHNGPGDHFTPHPPTL